MGIPIARIVAYLMLGKKIKDFPELKRSKLPYVGVKEAVFPFNMFPEVDPLLGPEMKATGEVMGIADTFGFSFYKAQEAAGFELPLEGNVLLTVADKDKAGLLPIAKKIDEMGLSIYATEGTNRFLEEHGIGSIKIKKIHEGTPILLTRSRTRKFGLLLTRRWGATANMMTVIFA